MSADKAKQMPAEGIIVVLLLGVVFISILDGLFEAHLKWSDVQQARSSVEQALDTKPEEAGFEGIWLQAKQLAYENMEHGEFIWITYGKGWSVSADPEHWMSFDTFKERIFFSGNRDKHFRLFGGCLDTKIKSSWVSSKNRIHIPLQDRGEDYDYFDTEAVYFFLCAAQRYDTMSFQDLWETEYTRFIVPKITEKADLYGVPSLWRELHYDPLDRLDRATLEAILPKALKGRFQVKPLSLEEWVYDEFRWRLNREPSKYELKKMKNKERPNWQKYCRVDIPKIRAHQEHDRATVVELLRSMGDL